MRIQFRRAVLVMLILTGTSAARAEVIYSDDFNGAATTDLNGLAPDVRPGNETWLSATGDAGWKADGSINKSGENVNSNSFLPFVPAAGNVYTLSIDANPNDTLVNDSDWFALGFTSAANVTTPFNSNPLQAAPWMLLRSNVDDPSFSAYSASGPVNSGLVSHSLSNSGFVNLKIVLDTTQPAWSAEWFFDGSSVRVFDYSTNPTINFVAFVGYDEADGFVDNFVLSDASAVVPEPATQVLTGLAIVGIVAICRRRN